MKISDIPKVNQLLKQEFERVKAPLMELVAVQTKDPFKILLGTILSSRTRDATTATVCARLFQQVATPADLARLSVEEIEKLIYPAGFYRAKAKQLHALPAVLQERFGGIIPQSIEELCLLPGVGRKTANLVVALGFGKPAICVDVHVHRITNRLGLLKTKNPYETEMKLREILPQKYWINWNSFLVAFGQTRCAPRNPKCQGCPLLPYCNHGMIYGECIS